MKRLIAMLFLAGMSNAMAEGRHHHGNDSEWLLPAIIGSAIVGGALYNYATPPQPLPPPAYYPPQPVRPPPGYYSPIPYGYHQQTIFDPYCNCYRTALLPD